MEVAVCEPELRMKPGGGRSISAPRPSTHRPEESPSGQESGLGLREDAATSTTNLTESLKKFGSNAGVMVETVRGKLAPLLFYKIKNFGPPIHCHLARARHSNLI